MSLGAALDFEAPLAARGHEPLRCGPVRTLQLNIGRRLGAALDREEATQKPRAIEASPR